MDHLRARGRHLRQARGMRCTHWLPPHKARTLQGERCAAVSTCLATQRTMVPLWHRSRCVFRACTRHADLPDVQAQQAIGAPSLNCNCTSRGSLSHLPADTNALPWMKAPACRAVSVYTRGLCLGGSSLSYLPFVSSTSPLTYGLCLPVQFFIRKCDVASTTNALSEQHIWRGAARDVPRSYVRVIVPVAFLGSDEASQVIWPNPSPNLSTFPHVWV